MFLIKKLTYIFAGKFFYSHICSAKHIRNVIRTASFG